MTVRFNRCFLPVVLTLVALVAIACGDGGNGGTGDAGNDGSTEDAGTDSGSTDAGGNDGSTAASAAAAAITITNIDDVRGSLTLPTMSNGFPVTWSSSNPSVVSPTGVVVRPGANTDVVLTATVVDGATSVSRTFIARVRAAVTLAPFEGYAFAYFTASTIPGEKIYFAASDGNDALEWDELLEGQPMFTSTHGTLGLRDPFIIRSPEGDTFYLIATDLSIGSGTSWGDAVHHGSLYIEVWESHDLVSWSPQRHVRVSPSNAGNTWAPEAYYDESIDAYVVFWASALYADDDPNHTANVPQNMFYATTRDFVTFSAPQLWQNISRIDSTVIRVPDDDGYVYHRFTKDEGAGTTGCSDIIQETSTQLLAPLSGWTVLDSCIGAGAMTGAVEGPTVFRSNPGDVHGSFYYLFVDEYGGRGYIPLRTADISAPDWQVAPAYNLPTSPRHGTVLPVTASELASLRAMVVTIPDAMVNAEGEVLRYDFASASGTTLTDVSGNGYHGTIMGGASVASGELVFDGTDDYVDLPDNLLAGVVDVTVEAEVYLDAAQAGNYFIYGFGNTDGSGAGNGYLFSEGDPYRAAIATGNWSTEQVVSQGVPLARAGWHHIAFTLEASTARLYLDGVQVASSTMSADPEDIGNGRTMANYLGRSMYNADNRFRGRLREFALYNRALSAAEIAAHAGN